MSGARRAPVGPDLADLRDVCQPPEVMGRVNAEHWAGRLYMRHVSLHLTRALLRTRISANGVTGLMMGSGLLSAAALAIPGLWSALLAALLIQLQLLLDCSDGEVARWRRTTGPAGIYLDRIGHYTTDASLVAALGVRADGGPGEIAGWTTLGLLTAVLVLLVKAENDLVHTARALAGLPKVEDAAFAPRAPSLRNLRRLAGYLPVYRALTAVELSALGLAAAVVDTLSGSLTGSRGLLTGLVVVAGSVSAGHLVVILASNRLR